MPAKRIILLKRALPGAMSYRYVLWADVPSGNQLAYRNPLFTSTYENVSPAELQALRDGQVAEQTGVYKASNGTSQATMETAIEGYWTAFQAEVTAETPWGLYGRYWSSAPAWNATTGVPWATTPLEVEPASFLAQTPVSVYAANKYHLVLANAAVAATSQGFLVKVHLVVVQPQFTAVTGVAPTAWSLRRRNDFTTAPSGGAVTAAPLDSAQALPSMVTIHNAPSTAPAGGTTIEFHSFIPQADEVKLSTLDQPGMLASQPWSGQTIFSAAGGRSPIILRPSQTLEVVQSGTAGTGNCRVLVFFSIG